MYVDIVGGTYMLMETGRARSESIVVGHGYLEAGPHNKDIARAYRRCLQFFG